MICEWFYACSVVHTAVLLWVVPELLDLLANLSVWHLDIILHLTIIGHQGKESIVGDIKLSFC